MTFQRFGRARPRKIRKPAGSPSAAPGAGRAPGKLTARQRLFVREFVSGKPGVRGVAIRAAEAAGYSLADMGIGAQLVRTPSVRAAIARHFEKWDLKAQDVIDELRRVAFSDVRRYVDWDGENVTLKSSDELTDDDAAAVAEVSKTETERGGTVRFKLHDKLAALGMLAKFLGVAADRIEHTGPGGGPVRVDGAVTFYLPAPPRLALADGAPATDVIVL